MVRIRQSWAALNVVKAVAGCALLSVAVPAYASQVRMRASAEIVESTGIAFEQRMIDQSSLTLILSGTESDLLSVMVPSDLNRIDGDSLYPMLERGSGSPPVLDRYAVSVALGLSNQADESRYLGDHLLVVAQYN